jgi:hypothetical protein
MYKSLVSALVLIVAIVSPVFGQVRGVDIRSAEAQSRIQQYNQNNGLNQARIKGEFVLTSLKVGYKGVPSFIDCRIISVVDETNVVAELTDARVGNRSRVVVWLKVYTSKNVVDGTRIIHGKDWFKYIGAKKLKVIGTKRYETVNGGYRTVYEVEAYRDNDGK